MPWFRDRRLLFALALGLVVRLLFALSSYDDACIRDECTYLKMAERLVSGQGITSSAGWLWAPGYPFLLGVAKYLFGYGAGIVALQIVCAGVSAVLVYAMALRAFEGDTRVARTAALLYLLSPHQAFFSTRLWSEVIYGTILLGVLLLIDRARPQAAVSIVSTKSPWHWLTVSGRVVDIRPDEGLLFINKMSQKYTGSAYGRNGARERFFIEVDSVKHSGQWRG